MSAVAKPARFAPRPHRRAMIAKVHLASKQLGLDEDTYRGTLYEVTGRMSAADCTDGDLAALLKHFEAKGFRARPKGPGRRSAADHPAARKARALWLSLHSLGAVDNASEQALEAFARRQLKVAALQWADQGQCYKLIEALKAMAERAGWAQGDYPADTDADARLRILKMRLCDAILVRMKDAGIVPATWRLSDAAWRLCGISAEYGVYSWSTEDLDRVARSLGAKLRGDER